MADENESAFGDGVVETLKIEIVGDTDKAEKSLDSLIAKLDALGKAVNGSSGAKSLNETIKAVEQVTQKSDAKLKDLTDKAASASYSGYKRVEETLKKVGEAPSMSGYDRVEETLREASSEAKEFGQRMEEALSADEVINTTSKLDILDAKLKATKTKLQELLDQKKGIDDSTVARLVEQSQRLKEAIEEIKRSEESGRSGKPILSADEVIGSTSQLDILTGKLKNVKDDMNALFKEGAARDDPRILRMVEQAQRLEKAIGETGEKTDDLSKKVSVLDGKFGRLASMFTRRVLYRGINAVISLITNGFKEGIENVYQYSKAMDGLFASSMDKLSTERLYIHNSLGAAASALITAATPLLLNLGDLLVDVTNGFNQFFAAMSGAKTWTKAVKYPTEYAEAMGDAANANKDFKASVLGFDQLNILSGVEDAVNAAGSGLDYSKMFEEVSMADSSPLLQTTGEMLGWIVNTALPAIATFINDNKGILLGTLVGAGIGKVVNKIKNFSKNAKVPELFKSFLTGFSDVRESGGNVFEALKGGVDGFRSNLSTTQQLIGTAAGAFVAFDGARKSVKNLYEEECNVVSGISSIIESVGGIAIAYATGGTIGAAIAIVGELAGAFTAVYEEEQKAREKLEEFQSKLIDEEIYKKSGILLDEVKQSLQRYLDTMDFDKIGEWREKIEEVSKAYQAAKTDWENMWTSISQRDKLTDEDVADLSTSFNNLAQAAQAVSDQKIEGLMESINRGITDYLSVEVQTQVEGLTTKLQTLKYLVDQEYTGLSAQFAEIMEQVQANGGDPTKEQKKEIDRIVEQMSKLTLSDMSGSTRWEEMREKLLYEGVNAGTDRNAFESAVKKLAEERDTYLNQLSDNYYAQIDQLKELIYLDQSVFGGKAGLDDSDLLTLKQSYLESVQLIMDQYTDVLNGIFMDMPDAVSAKELIQKAGKSGVVSGKLADREWSMIQEWLNSGEGNTIDDLAGYLRDEFGYDYSNNRYIEGAINSAKSYYDRYFEQYTADLIDMRNDVLSEAATNSSYYDKKTSDTLDEIQESFEKYWEQWWEENLEEQMQAAMDAAERMNAKDNHFASGGYPDTGEMFIAREAGPELVGRIGRRTAVANNDQIVESVSMGVAEANAEQNSLIREGLSLLRRLADKEFSATAYISTSDAVSAFDRMNRRAGKQLVRQDT